MQKLLEFLSLDSRRAADKVSGSRAACRCFSLWKCFRRVTSHTLSHTEGGERVPSWGWSSSGHTVLLSSDGWVSEQH